eukprot:662013-Pelagomonas_calceolata.AAC.5
MRTRGRELGNNASGYIFVQQKQKSVSVQGGKGGMDLGEKVRRKAVGMQLQKKKTSRGLWQKIMSSKPGLLEPTLRSFRGGQCRLTIQLTCIPMLEMYHAILGAGCLRRSWV